MRWAKAQVSRPASQLSADQNYTASGVEVAHVYRSDTTSVSFLTDLLLLCFFFFVVSVDFLVVEQQASEATEKKTSHVSYFRSARSSQTLRCRLGCAEKIIIADPVLGVKVHTSLVMILQAAMQETNCRSARWSWLPSQTSSKFPEEKKIFEPHYCYLLLVMDEHTDSCPVWKTSSRALRLQPFTESTARLNCSLFIFRRYAVIMLCNTWLVGRRFLWFLLFRAVLQHWVSSCRIFGIFGRWIPHFL